jgi:hypothetical protein
MDIECTGKIGAGYGIAGHFIAAKLKRCARLAVFRRPRSDHRAKAGFIRHALKQWLRVSVIGIRQQDHERFFILCLGDEFPEARAQVGFISFERFENKWPADDCVRGDNKHRDAAFTFDLPFACQHARAAGTNHAVGAHRANKRRDEVSRASGVIRREKNHCQFGPGYPGARHRLACRLFDGVGGLALLRLSDTGSNHDTVTIETSAAEGQGEYVRARRFENRLYWD